MKKTFLLLTTLTAMFSIALESACAQQVKYTVEQTNLMEVKQSRNGWQKSAPVYVELPRVPRVQPQAQSHPDLRRMPVPAGSRGSRNTDLPQVAKPRTQGYMSQKGSGRTRKGSRSPEEVAAMQQSQHPPAGALKPVAASTGNNAPVRPRHVYSPPAKPFVTGTKRATWTENVTPKTFKVKSRAPQQPSHYAATYGDYDPKAKKKRNY